MFLCLSHQLPQKQKKVLPEFLQEKMQEFENQLKKHSEEQRQFSLLILSFLTKLQNKKELN